MRNEERLFDRPAKFELQEEAKAPVIASAVETTFPLIPKEPTTKKWRLQMIKVSVKELSKDD